MRIFVTLFLCFTGFLLSARPSVLFSMCTFDNPAGKPYVEVYLSTSAGSIQAVPKVGGKFQGTIQVKLVIKKDNVVVFADKYNLISPESDKKELTHDFTDLQRIPTGNGTYRMEVHVTDLNAPGSEPFTAAQDFIVDYQPDRISISDIELLESYSPTTAATRFSRNGMDMVPFPSNYYPPGMEKVKFYAEVYRAATVLGPDSAFILRYRLDKYETKKPAANLGGLLKVKAKDVNVLLNEISIADLPSGNYNLVVEVVNRQNAVLASRKLMIQHVSKILIPLAGPDTAGLTAEGSFVESIPADSLREFIRTLYPIASYSENNAAKNLVKGNDVAAMQRHFFIFWINRNPLDPEGAWAEYKGRVDEVNAHYKTFNSKGYETDRGRVYLQYGSPNTIDESKDEPGTYPYEVWHYYVLGTQSNKRFVFMTKNRSSNDYELLHSDAIGERNNPRWVNQLSDQHNNFGLGTGDPARDGNNNPYGTKPMDVFQRPK